MSHPSLSLSSPFAFENRAGAKIERSPAQLRLGLDPGDPVTVPGSSPTGIERLDRLLPGGGLPAGLTELTGRRASGRLGLAFAMLEQCLARGEEAALVDPEATACPDVWSRGELERLLVVRGGGLLASLRAASALLQTGAFSLLVLDLPGRATIATGSRSRSVTTATFLRLGHEARRAATPLVVLSERLPWRPHGIASLASLRLEVQPRPRGIEVTVARSRHGGAGQRARLGVEPPAPRRAPEAA